MEKEVNEQNESIPAGLRAGKEKSEEKSNKTRDRQKAANNDITINTRSVIFVDAMVNKLCALRTHILLSIHCHLFNDILHIYTSFLTY